MKRIRIYALALAALCVAAMFLVERISASEPHTITITGTAATVVVSATDIQADSFQVTVPASNSGTARLGDSTTSSTVGEALPAGSGQYFAPRAAGAYSLNTWYVYVANGDKLTVIWADKR